MNPFKELNSKYRTLENGLGSLVTIAREAEQEEIAERAKVTLSKAKERVFRVAIAGEFSTGKSTAINALLGEELLPTALEACTAVVTRIRRAEEGEEPGILVTFKKSGQRRIEKERLREVLTFEGQIIKDPPIEALVILPSGTFLDHGIEIIDTPGVNDPDARGEQVTLGFLPQADAIIFITHAARAFKESEIEFLRDRIGNQDRQRVLFVVNACDILEEEDDRDDLRSRGKTLLETIYGKPEIHLVSARNGLRARISGDADQWKLSGMAAFQENLDRLLMRERGAAELKRNQALALDFRSELQRRIQDKIEDLGLDDEIRDRRAVRVEEGIALLEREEKNLLKSVEENFRSVRNSVDGALSEEMIGLDSELRGMQSHGMEEQHQDITDRAQQAVQSCGKRALTRVQSTLRSHMVRVHDDLASQMSRSIGEAERIFSDGKNAIVTIETPNFGNLVSVHTNREVEERQVEEETGEAASGMSEAQGGLMGAGIAGAIGLALLGPWGILVGAFFGAGAGSSMTGHKGEEVRTVFKTVKDYFVTQSVEASGVISALKSRISGSVEPAVSALEERTRFDAQGVYSAKIAEFRERLVALHEPTREAAERDQQRKRAEKWLKKLRKIPLPAPTE
jgi:GTPase Era involved in 16S rRNA processing